MKHPIPSELKPENIICVQDSREQEPLDLSPMAVEVGTLATGDYSVKGLEHVVAIERKGLGDFLGCVGGNRERFEECIQRMKAYPFRCIVIEATFPMIEAGEWRSQVTPAAALAAVLAWSMKVGVCLAGSHERAGRYVADMLRLAAQNRWKEGRRVYHCLDVEPAAKPAPVPDGRGGYTPF